MSASALAFLMICYGLMRFAAGHLRLPRPRTFAGATSTISVLVLVLLVVLPIVREHVQQDPDTTSEAVLAALQHRPSKLDTIHAGNGFDDLQPLRAVLNERDARIVALGEATHGTSEFFKMKHRLLAFLVREMGFQHIGLEIRPVEAVFGGVREETRLDVRVDRLVGLLTRTPSAENGPHRLIAVVIYARR